MAFSNTELIAFFKQRMVELYDRNTLDSYSVRTCNTMSIFCEMREIINGWIIGNVKDGIDNNKLRPFLMLDRTTQSKQECIDCEVASGCAWCQGENYDAADTHTIYQRATAICKMHKARVRANNYYWNKLFRKLELVEYEEQKQKSNITLC